MTAGMAFALATLALLLLTKVADCLSTLRRIRDPGQETNPTARRLMARWGIGPTVLAYGLLATVISVMSALPCLWDDSGWYTAGFTLLGLAVAAVQADVAWSNWRGRLGPLAQLVARWHARQSGADRCGARR